MNMPDKLRQETQLILPLEVEQVSVVKCDLSGIPPNEFQWRQNPVTKERYHSANLLCKMVNSLTHLEVDVLTNGTRIGFVKIPTQAQRTSSSRSGWNPYGHDL